MRINKKQIFVLFGLLIAAIIFNFGYKNKPQLMKIETAKAIHGANVFGWAWADLASGNTERGLGWISFNSKNCDGNPEDGIIDPGAPAGCSVIGNVGEYGVSIDQSTGLLSGFGWIGEESSAGAGPTGWVSFQVGDGNSLTTDDLDGCPTLPCEARMNVSTRQLSGWAKVLTINSVDSTEGWIHLSGIAQDNSSYGLSVDNSGNINGWAWGNALLGWVSFSCNNLETDNSSCTSANYQVTTNTTQPINLTTSLDGGQTQEDYCQESINPTSGVDTIQFNWNSSATDFTLQVDQIPGSSSFGTFWDRNITSTTNTVTVTERRDIILPSAISGYTNLCGSATCTFNWRVREGTGAWVSGAPFVLTNHDWPKATINGPSITQSNTSVTYDSSSSIIYQGITALLSWSWPLQFTTNSSNTAISIIGSFSPDGQYNIYLDVTDNDSHTCRATYPINVGLIIPRWREISP